ncbi:hypothetical protein X743_32340 [Mesorhizobium sp. LNHC252B00]|nr:hypothetical protein X743_32340 [Mesorhizobium sp. LNHC252B00]
MQEYRVEIIVSFVVVSSFLAMDILPFKVAEKHSGRPVTLRRNEENWIRVTETGGQKRTFSYVVRGKA